MALHQLTGEYQHSMDAKGRVKMPAAWGEELGQAFMVTRGTGKMLFIFSLPQWEVFSQKLMALPMMDPKAQAIRRIFGAGASPCELDAQGRFVIPKQLRAYANLQKDVVIAGAFTWGEIWDAEAWQNYETQFADNASDSFMELMQSLTESFSLRPPPHTPRCFWAIAETRWRFRPAASRWMSQWAWEGTASRCSKPFAPTASSSA